MIELTAKQTEAMQAVESERFDFILYGGAIRGGKTVWGLSALLVLCQIYPKSRWCIIREDLEKIRTTTIPSFTKLEPSGKLRQSPYEYVHPNGSVILFKSENYALDKDLDWMKGLEVNGILFEEINECQKQTFFKAFERSGTWILTGAKYQPKPIVLATCNPTYGWVKELIYDRWKIGSLPVRWKYIPAKITDNVDKDGKLNLPQAYIDNLSNLPIFEYMVFVEGNWDIQLKTGGEYLRSFELSKHVKPIKRDDSATIHISIDSNVYPYIAVSVFQLIKNGSNWIVRQIDELPAIDPDNSALRAGKKIANYLIGYTQPVFLYGDRSTKSRNNIDDNKRSFYQIVNETIQTSGFTTVDKMDKHAPPVASIGDFVNSIFDGMVKGIEIEIGENCKASISDYIETKTDKDGGILKKRITDPKTKVSYEPHGHLTDCLKDFIYQAFTEEYNSWLKRFDVNEYYSNITFN
jgi:hypothetical protein